MRLTLTLAGLLASSLALTACSDNAEPVAAVADVERASGAGEAIPLANLPTQRAGIWRTTTTVNGEPQEPVRECIAANQPLFDEEDGLAECSPAIQRLPTGFRLRAQCRSEGITGRVEADITGDFQRRLRMTMQTTQTLAGQEPVTLSFRSESVYEGACAPGQEPGEIEG